MLSAAELYGRGVEHGNAGRHAAARRDLSAARLRHPDPDLAARIAGTWVYLVSESGDAAETAAAISACAAALADGSLTPHTRAVIRSQLGLVELRRGDADAALAHLAAAVPRLGDDPARLGHVLLNRGLVHLDRSEVLRAQSDFASAADAFERAGDSVGRAKAQNNQGYAAMLGGDLVSAIRLMDASVPVLATLSPVSAAVGEADRAEVLLAAGMTADAVVLLRRAARVYGSRRLRQAQAEAELLLARTLAVEDPTAAASTARSAARRFRARGSAAWATRADAVALAGELAAGRRGGALLDRAERTARELDALHRADDAAALRLHVARARRSAPPRVGRSAGITTRLLADEVAVDALARGGRDGAILRRAASGLDALQDWQASFGSLELQSSAAVHGRRLMTDGIRTAVATGRPDVVYAWSERIRAMSATVVRMRPPAQASVAEDLAELRAVRGSGSRLEAELRERIRRSHWADDGATTARVTAPVDAVRAALAADDALLVAHLWTGDGVSALVVDGGGASVRRLAPWSAVEPLLDGMLVDLDMAAAELPTGIRDSVRAALDARLARLDALLLAPVLAGRDHRRLVLTPAGAFAGIPWTMLTSARGRAIALPATASGWLADRESAVPVHAIGLVAAPGVARGADEVGAASAAWLGAASLVGDAATADAVAGLAERSDLLHVAAHGRHAADNPLFSALELADGPWFGYDVDQLERVPGTVVLSACELGRSAVRGGLEALSGARAWLHAGARSVVASPAAVGDSAAAELLGATHAHLARGAGPADALAAASASTGIRVPFVCHGAGW